MKERLKEWGKNLTKLSMVGEVVGMGVATWIGSTGLFVFSAFGLGLDFVVLGRLNQENKNRSAASVSLNSLLPRGSQRFAFAN